MPRVDRRLYVIGDELSVKIGVSRAPTRRLAKLRYDHRRPLVLYYQSAILSHAMQVERTVHAKLKDHAIGFEWFAVGPERAQQAIEAAIGEALANEVERHLPAFSSLQGDPASRLDLMAFVFDFKRLPSAARGRVLTMMQSIVDAHEAVAAAAHSSTPTRRPYAMETTDTPAPPRLD